MNAEMLQWNKQWNHNTKLKMFICTTLDKRQWSNINEASIFKMHEQTFHFPTW